MLKRIPRAVAAAALALCLAVSAFASVPYISGSVEPPVITDGAEEVTETDRVITFSYTARTAEPEAFRKIYLEKLQETYSDEEIAASDEEWCLHGTVVFCEVSADGGEWFPVRTLPPESGAAELSLFGDIMPALAKGGVELYRRIYGFDYSLRLVTASDNYDAHARNRVFAVSAPSETLTFHCPEFTFVDCVVPDDAELTMDYPAFMYYPNETELPLPYPVRRGYSFAGWLQWNGGYTETVPAHTRYYRVTAQWDPRSYAVNYVLATDIKFNFGRANNSANPTRHTVGDSETLYDVKSPVGGYAFDGWYLTEDFSGERLTRIPEDTMGDIILYAKWVTFEELEARDREQKEAYARSLHYGDLDLDDRVSASDARLALRLSVGLETLPPEALRRADIFDTGIVTAATARSILRVAVGLDSMYDILYSHGIIRPGELEGTI